jgi:hypothetical protein
VLAESVSGELISSEIEIRSGRGESFDHGSGLTLEGRARVKSVSITRQPEFRDRQGRSLSRSRSHDERYRQAGADIPAALRASPRVR